MEKNMELEKAIEKLNYKKTIRDLKDYVKDNNCILADSIDVVLKELEKKDKMIELMADWFSDYNLYEDDCGNECLLIQNSCYEWQCGKDCRQCIKQYFEKKAEESE